LLRHGRYSYGGNVAFDSNLMSFALFGTCCLSTPINRFFANAITLTTNGTFHFYQAASTLWKAIFTNKLTTFLSKE
jgi:hypothetical protein